MPCSQVPAGKLGLITEHKINLKADNISAYHHSAFCTTCASTKPRQIQVYSEASPTAFSEAYSQGGEHRTVT